MSCCQARYLPSTAFDCWYLNGGLYTYFCWISSCWFQLSVPTCQEYFESCFCVAALLYDKWKLLECHDIVVFQLVISVNCIKHWLSLGWWIDTFWNYQVNVFSLCMLLKYSSSNFPPRFCSFQIPVSYFIKPLHWAASIKQNIHTCTRHTACRVYQRFLSLHVFPSPS